MNKNEHALTNILGSSLLNLKDLPSMQLLDQSMPPTPTSLAEMTGLRSKGFIKVQGTIES